MAYGFDRTENGRGAPCGLPNRDQSLEGEWIVENTKQKSSGTFQPAGRQNASKPDIAEQVQFDNFPESLDAANPALGLMEIVGERPAFLAALGDGSVTKIPLSLPAKSILRRMMATQ